MDQIARIRIDFAFVTGYAVAMQRHLAPLIAKLDAWPGLEAGQCANPNHALLASHSLSIRLPGGGVAHAGRAGLKALSCIRRFHALPPEDVAFSAGHFCEVAAGGAFLCGGEHANDAVINCTFGQAPVLKWKLEQAGVRIAPSHTRGPIRLGSNVLISRDVIVRSGVQIGDGAVIGAGAVVTRDIPPFAIAAGNPARVLRYRFDEETIAFLQRLRWWDLSQDSLIKAMPLLHRAEGDPAAREELSDAVWLRYHDDSNRLVFEMREQHSNATFHPIGIERGGAFMALEGLPDIYILFFSQLSYSPQQRIFFIGDVFDLADQLAPS